MLTLLTALALAQAAGGGAAKPAGPRAEKVKCQRIAITGTLAGFTKVCGTETQWRKLEERGYNEGKAMQEQGLITSCSKPPC